MKALIFDSGPIISLTLNNLLWLLRPLKEKFKGEFYITKAVYGEVIGHPLETKRFKFEAFQVLNLVKDKTLRVIDSQQIQKRAEALMETANSIYYLGEQRLRMFHFAEMSVMAAAVELKAEAAVVDEQMTRIVLENPNRVIELLTKRMHRKPSVNTQNLLALQKELREVKIIRSAELAAVGYEFGMLDQFVADSSVLKQPRMELIDAILWGLKINGCAISEKEIKQLVKIEGR